MARQNVTNHQLLRYSEEIKVWEKQDSLQFHFNFGKIREFLKMNSVRIRTLEERLRNYEMDFYKHELKDGIPIWENDNGKPVFKEGKTQEEFDSGLKLILQEETVVEL